MRGGRSPGGIWMPPCQAGVGLPPRLARVSPPAVGGRISAGGMALNPPSRPTPPRPGIRRLLRRGLLGLAMLAALLAVGHALLWRWMGSQLEAGFQDWAAQRRALGWRGEHAPPLRGGWPLAATLTLPRFRLEGGGATLVGGLAGGLEWQADALVLRLAPPRLDRLVVEMPGRQRLRLGALGPPLPPRPLAATPPPGARVAAPGGRPGG